MAHFVQFLDLKMVLSQENTWFSAEKFTGSSTSIGSYHLKPLLGKSIFLTIFSYCVTLSYVKDQGGFVQLLKKKTVYISYYSRT